MIINISKEYTKTPGGRYIKEGPFSGEEFRISMLKPAYCKAKESGEKLTVILDGGYGYGTSFLEESFGGLVRDLKDPDILNIVIISEEEPSLVQKIKCFVNEALLELKR